MSLGPGWTQDIPKREEEPAPRRGRRRRERGPYEWASIVFGAIIVGFALWGGITALTDGKGPGSPEFVISSVFFLLGAGRVYWGLRAP